MLIPPLFLLSLALAQPVSAAPPDDAAPPWGHVAIPESGVVFGECTGSGCPAPRAEGGPARVPAPLRAAPLVVPPRALGSNVAPDLLGVNIAPGALGVNIAPDAVWMNVAPNAPRVYVAPDAPRVEFAPDVVRVDSASDMRSDDGGQTPTATDDAVPFSTDIARGDGTGSASSLPRVVGDLVSRLLDLVRLAPLPLTR